MSEVYFFNFAVAGGRDQERQERRQKFCGFEAVKADDRDGGKKKKEERKKERKRKRRKGKKSLRSVTGN